MHTSVRIIFFRWFQGASLALVLGLVAMPVAFAREDLGFAGKGDSKPKPYLAPDGSFAATIPNFWQPREFREAHVVEFRMPGAGNAWLQIRRSKVAARTLPRQLLLRAREERLTKLPHFREFNRRDIMVGGSLGASILGDYWYQGNAEYPRAVEEVFVVINDEAFEMHFECFEPIVDAVRGDLMTFYMSFVAHPEATPAPRSSGDKKDSSYFDNLPF